LFLIHLIGDPAEKRAFITNEQENPILRRLFVLFFAVFLSVATAWAADTASIAGSAQDSSGAVISNADIYLTSAASGAVTHQTSDASGKFVLSGLVSGSYTLVVTKGGFDS
jgi:hypothetical protein